MKTNPDIIGKAKTVLVFGRAPSARAVLSSVVVRARRQVRPRLLFRGPVRPDAALGEHLSQVVLAAVEQITARLGVQSPGFTLEVVTPAATAVAEIATALSGFSADVPIFLALLSAALELPLRQDIVTTGHLGSSDGELRPVKHLAAKLAAAQVEGKIRQFFYPALDADGSLEIWTPEEKGQIQAAVATARNTFTVTAVADIGELLPQVLREESLLLAAFRRDFFGKSLPAASTSPLEGASAFLTADHEKRFWLALSLAFATNELEAGRRLLGEGLRCHLRRKIYPCGWGANLLPLVTSLPVPVRRRPSLFPLVGLRDCFRLAQFARREEQADAQTLLQAVEGKRLPELHRSEARPEPAPGPKQAQETVEAVLDAISPAALTQRIGLPIDGARAAYVIPEIVLESHEEFFDQIESFYLALLRPLTGGVVMTHDMLAAEAHDLLARAFSDRGGVDAAWAEARHGTKGGMRYVLDMMTERFREDRQAQWINQVLKTALDSSDWPARVAFMRAFLDRIGPQLSPEIRSQPPERFARHYELILPEYVRSLNQVSRILQRL